MIHNHFDKAKRFARGVMTLGAVALLPFMTACCDYEDALPAEDMVPLSFYLQTAGSQQTRAYIGDLAAETEAESAINDVKVWIYQNGECVAFTENIAANKVTTSVAQSVLGGTVDVYIIANAKSAGLEALDGSASLADLNQATIDVSKFSAAAPVTDVPEDGLPMSIIKKGCTINAENIPATLQEIKVTRAVSKIYFAFGMYDGDFGEIVSITLNGEQISKSEYILPVDYAADAADYTSPYWGDLQTNIKAADGYEASAITFQGTEGAALFANSTIYKTTTDENPADYTWENWSAENGTTAAQQYYSAIAPFVKQKVYLRESDKKLKGTISYRMTTEDGATAKTIDFEMDPASTIQDFARNHVWIVYSYFEGGKLYVKPTVVDWIDAPVLDYEMKMSTQMRLFDSWLYRYDTVDQDYTNWTNWAGSHMVVSEGRITTATETETVVGRPIRSPQIQLLTTGVTGSSFELTVDNSDFEIVQAVKDNDGKVTAYTASTDGVLTIPAGDDVYTYFYVVPKAGTPANPVAKVSLIYNDPVLGPQKVTFNYNSLPGYSDDSSEIWVYYVPADQYNITDKLKMYFQDNNNPLVPTPVQS